MKVLQLTVHFSPNLGGVETHLDDLVKELTELKHQVFVLTYRPLSTNSVWSMWEKRPLLKILRLPWLPGLFNKLSTYPTLEFLYLAPGLFITLPFILILSRPQVIHSHGLVAGFVATFWGRLFNIRTVNSTHSIYHFPNSGLYRTLARYVFLTTNQTLCLSNQSLSEVLSLGVPADRVHRFTYWVDLEKFRPHDKLPCKRKLGWKGKITVLFVGRLVAEKGIPQLLQAAQLFRKGIDLKIAGSGPLESTLGKYYVGRISQDILPIYYSAADIVVVPSTHEEGFGRVILESLACGTPVVAANRGAIPEAVDESVGMLIDITPQNIAQAVNTLSADAKMRSKLANAAIAFAKTRYSHRNISAITDSYK